MKLRTWKVDSILFKIVKVIVVAATVEVINEKRKLNELKLSLLYFLKDRTTNEAPCWHFYEQWIFILCHHLPMYHQDAVMILPPLSHKLTYFLYQAVKKGGYTANLGTTLFFFFATFKAFCQKRRRRTHNCLKIIEKFLA